MTPAVILIGVFAPIPIGWSLLLSLQSTNLIAPAHYVGLANYRALTKDPQFRSAIGHTLVYTVLFVPVSVIGALGSRSRSTAVPRGPLLPAGGVRTAVTSTVATGIIFCGCLTRRSAWSTTCCTRRAAQQQLGDPEQALDCIVAMTVWGWLGFDVIIYRGAAGHPQDLMEASETDGASRWATFRRSSCRCWGPRRCRLEWSTINALQLFDEIYVTTRGGPLGRPR